MTLLRLSDSPSMDFMKRSISNGELLPETEQDRWNRLFDYVKGHFPKVKNVDRSSFPKNFELREYEELMEWRCHCDDCTRPENCPHYGYRGRIKLRRIWQGREYPDGIFVPEYYGGKCDLFLKALGKIRERKEANKAEKANPPREKTISFRC